MAVAEAPCPILQGATARGFTRVVEGSSTVADLRLVVEPTADLNSHFEAVCLDTGERLIVNGWLFDWAE